MKIATGRVVGGKVVVEGEGLVDGAVVTVLARENDGTIELSPEEEEALLAAIVEVDSGETVSGEELLREIRGSR